MLQLGELAAGLAGSGLASISAGRTSPPFSTISFRSCNAAIRAFASGVLMRWLWSIAAAGASEESLEADDARQQSCGNHKALPRGANGSNRADDRGAGGRGGLRERRPDAATASGSVLLILETSSKGSFLTI